MRKIKVLSLGTLYDFPDKAQRSSVEEAWKLYKKQNKELAPALVKTVLADFAKNIGNEELAIDIDYQNKRIELTSRTAGLSVWIRLRPDFVEKVTFQTILRSLG